MVKEKYMQLHIHSQIGGIYVIDYIRTLPARLKKERK